jgi:hypothetical protein
VLAHLTATVADPRSGILASAHFRLSGEVHRELEAWARQFGQIARWEIEGSASWGRHTAMFLVGRGHDVRDVCPNRTPRSDRALRRGKSDMLDSERIAREVLAHSLLTKAFKRTGQEQGPDEQHQLLALWNNRRRSILTGRQHLVGEAEYLLCELPLGLREQLPDTTAVKPRLASLARRNPRRRYDAPTRLRLQLLDDYRAQIKALDDQERQVRYPVFETSAGCREVRARGVEREFDGPARRVCLHGRLRAGDLVDTDRDGRRGRVRLTHRCRRLRYRDCAVGVVGVAEGTLGGEPGLQRGVQLVVVPVLVGGGGHPPADVDVVVKEFLGELGAPTDRV